MILERLRKLQKQIQHPVLIKKPENLFYLTGQKLEGGYLLVSKKQCIFFNGGLEKVEGIKQASLKDLSIYLSIYSNIYLEDWFTLAELEYFKSKCKGLKIQYGKSLVDLLRRIKDKNETEQIKKSMQIVERVFLKVRKEIKKSNITEIQLAEFIEKQGLKMGLEGLSFPAIVASGYNSAIPHHKSANKKLKKGEPIVIDFGFKYKGYCSDFTRTVFLKKVPSKLEIVYNQVEKAYNQAIDFVSPDQGLEGGSLKTFIRGVKASNLHQKAVDVLAEKKLDKYFIHSLGHGTGLEIHEWPYLGPNSKDILVNGTVFSIEPGVYIPKLGGVRIEDLVLLQESGAEKFINISTKLKDNIL